MTRRLVIRPRAVADLEDIWSYSAKEWSVPQADAYTAVLRGALDRLTQNPGSGAVFDHARTGYRRLVVESHAVFYRATDDQLDVVRILHQRRNAARLLR